ncbi:MAG: HPP family protein [Bdellovibrionales bacterium]
MELLSKNIMSSDLIVTHVEELMSDAYVKLLKNDIRHLPVVDDAEKIVGIISDRDFKKAMWRFSDNEQRATFDDEDVVGDFMSWPVKTITPDMGVITVAKRMVNEKVSAYLVVDNNRLVGIVTHEDLLQAFISQAEENVDRKEEFLYAGVKDRGFAFRWVYNPQLGRFVSSHI